METLRARTGRSPTSPRKMAPWGASGSLRTHADDARMGEVRQAYSTREVSEQNRTTSGGGGGGKGPGQEEPAPVQHAPDTRPGQCEQQTRAGTPSSTTGQKDEVHGAPAPRLCARNASGGVLRPQAGCRSRGRRGDVAGLRA